MEMFGVVGVKESWVFETRRGTGSITHTNPATHPNQSINPSPPITDSTTHLRGVELHVEELDKSVVVKRREFIDVQAQLRVRVHGIEDKAKELDTARGEVVGKLFLGGL